MRAMRHGADVEALDDMAVADGVPTIVFHGDADATVVAANGDAVKTGTNGATWRYS